MSNFRLHCLTHNLSSRPIFHLLNRRLTVITDDCLAGVEITTESENYKQSVSPQVSCSWCQVTGWTAGHCGGWQIFQDWLRSCQCPVIGRLWWTGPGTAQRTLSAVHLSTPYTVLNIQCVQPSAWGVHCPAHCTYHRGGSYQSGSSTSYA